MEDPREYIPEESIGYLAGKLKREVSRYITRQLHELGSEITAEQLWLLLLLSQEETHNQQDIADLFSKDKTSIARMLQTMEKAGWIERVPKQDDKRNNLLFITSAGMVVKNKYQHVAMYVLDQAASSVPSNEFEQCKATLRQVIDHLRTINHDACKASKCSGSEEE